MLKNMSQIRKPDGTRLPCLRKVAKGKLFKEVRTVNQLLKKIESKDVTEGNDLFYLGVTMVTKVFEKNKTSGDKKGLGGKEDWKVKSKILTKIWED